MFENLLIAMLMMVLTTAIHATGTTISARTMAVPKKARKLRVRQTDIYRLSCIVLLMFAIALLEAGLWAVAYLVIGALETIEEAMYFSLVSFTTLGYGDVVLDQPWHILGGYEACNGVIMFGWSTAIVLNSAKHIFVEEQEAAREKGKSPID